VWELGGYSLENSRVGFIPGQIDRGFVGQRIQSSRVIFRRHSPIGQMIFQRIDQKSGHNPSHQSNRKTLPKDHQSLQMENQKKSPQWIR
jgi:hypothetical protein